MAKLTRKNLSRGIRLTVEHFFNLFDDLKSKLENVQIESESLENGRGTFRMNFSIPFLDSTLVESSTKNALLFPFILPPFQELFNSSYISSPELPNILLEEVTVSFDQRDEAVAIGAMNPNADCGKMTKRADQLALNISILQKTPTIVGSGIYPETQLLSFSIDSLAFSGEKFRVNPFTLTEKKIPIDPYKSMILQINAPNLATYSIALPSLFVSLKFSVSLSQRDSSGTVQNAPGLSYVANTISGYTKPSVGEVIKADVSKGTSFTGKLFDNILIKKIKGGLSKNGDRQIGEMILNDACYDVIVVPLFQGLLPTRAQDVAAGILPHCIGPGFVSTQDTRYIPINHPMVIHHVFVAQSFISPESVTLGHGANGVHHQDPDMGFDVGVAICSGMKQDHINDQQVAYLSYSQTTPYLVDRVKQSPTSLLNTDAFADVQLYQVPIVCNISRTGKGFSENGYPFFFTKGTTKTWARSNAGVLPFDFGGGAFHVPYTDGNETFLKVRGRIIDSINVGGLSTHANNPAQNIIIGSGGWFIYIIGKKTLV